VGGGALSLSCRARAAGYPRSSRARLVRARTPGATPAARGLPPASRGASSAPRACTHSFLRRSSVSFAVPTCSTCLRAAAMFAVSFRSSFSMFSHVVMYSLSALW
jgi:hypothetical protein